MKRNHKRPKKQRHTIQVWAHDQVQAALPYIASVMQSVREHRLEGQRLHLQAKRLAYKPGRSTRATSRGWTNWPAPSGLGATRPCCATLRKR